MKMKYLLLVIISLIPAPGFSQVSRETSEATFREASALYSSGKYNEALEKWLELYKSGYRSASLDQNIGNTYFKLNNVPGSVLFYERALLLRPASEDIRYNLQIARALVVDKFAEIPELFFITWFNFISLSLSSNTWATISIASFILSLLLISLYFYTSHYKFKVLGFWLGIFFLVASGASYSFASRNRSLVFNNDKAIIFSPVVNGKSSPDNSGNDLFIIHEGTKVIVGDKVGEWYEIRLSDGNKGWVPSNCLTKL
ncbi:MAG: SH3 domain-containing protein [Bacteroidales bacterium]|jgi:tetratricopeptide (TPR) repeat protein